MAIRKKKKSPNRAKEVDRILKNNLERGMIAKEDVFFARKFLNVLLEADELPSIGGDEEEDLVPLGGGTEASPEDLSADQNQVDFEASLETGTDSKQFDVQGTDSAEEFSNVYIKKCVGWVKKLDHISKWLNGLDNQSLNKELNDADREGSVFRGITRKVGSNIEKVAGEIDRIKNNLSNVITSSEKKQRELQKLTKIT